MMKHPTAERQWGVLHICYGEMPEGGAQIKALRKENDSICFVNDVGR